MVALRLFRALGRGHRPEPASGGALARFRSSGRPIRVGARPMPVGGSWPADGCPRAAGRRVPAGAASGAGDLPRAQGGLTLHRNPWCPSWPPELGLLPFNDTRRLPSNAKNANCSGLGGEDHHVAYTAGHTRHYAAMKSHSLRGSHDNVSHGNQ